MRGSSTVLRTGVRCVTGSVQPFLALRRIPAARHLLGIPNRRSLGSRPFIQNSGFAYAYAGSDAATEGWKSFFFLRPLPWFDHVYGQRGAGFLHIRTE